MASKPKTYRDALPRGQEVLWYRVRDVLGQGAFGITYLCEDLSGEDLLAVKEYLPPQVARRQSDQHLEPLSEALEEDYRHGLERFIAEVENLDRFKHPNIVEVVDIFEANNTAYLVMRYEKGESLQALLSRRGMLTEGEVLRILLPLLEGLDLIHGKGFVHRDVKPSNIFIRSDGGPVLLDFGSARQLLHLGSETVTNLVSPGYAPIEQYSSNAEKQGPWSDIYAFGATLYRALTGEIPAQAIARAEALVHGCPDPYLPASERARGAYSPALLSAVDHALAFKVRFRPQSIDAWRSAFDSCDPTAATAPPATPQPAVERPQPARDPATPWHEARVSRDAVGRQRAEAAGRPHVARRGRVLIKAAAVVLVSVGLIWFLAPRPQGNPPARVVASPLGEKRATLGETAGERGWEHAFVPLPPVIGWEAPGWVGEAPPTDDEEEEDDDADAAEHAMEAPAPVVPSPSESIARLLARANADLNANRLSVPAGNNALERYRRVLVLDPGNREAARGLRTIVLKYIHLAYRQMAARDLETAKLYLQRAAAIEPSNPDVLRAQRHLYARRREAASKSSAPGSMKRPSEHRALAMARTRARLDR